MNKKQLMPISLIAIICLIGCGQKKETNKFNLSNLELMRNQFITESEFLNNKERALGKKLNELVDEYSKDPSPSLLQQIDLLKTEIYEVKKDIERNLARYIEYLENTISKMNNAKFIPSKIHYESREK